ncbi:MAG: signal recognition particle-docking protein FtsY [Euryarchaeota archaeon]|jgi:fused signal recognition particle receptor|nr:signal recognition particle-docking protein FtsY [Euryarchaeota archaeon]MBT5453591.1 signal recognition particle-docking protein FtsY [Euryarchaeota archaeon]MBT5661608.1 signal recognition particle-docking protein FtsY [Euryarchaeota archaeon]
MGLFDKFRRRVREVASDVDEQALSADANSVEAKELLNTPTEPSKPTEDWDDLEAIEETEEVAQTTSSPDEDWDEWDDDEPTAPIVLTKKERKFLERQEKERKKKAAKVAKDMKKRGAVDVARPRGSKVDLTMMRTTTGRQLVKVKQDPKGSSKTAKLETEAGTTLDIELGGGVVNEGGRIIKPSAALDNLLEELEWVLLESDISQHATSALISSLRTALIGSRLRKGAELPKVLEAALKRALHGLLEAGYWDFDASVKAFIDAGDAPVVIMMVGVNGTGKTTTAAKIAQRLLNNNISVIAAAGDTFRAGAIQQLESHCENLGIRCISSQRGGDSAAIARDAIDSAKARGIDVVLVDTAGRMQNKTNLMNELNKVRKVTNPHLTLFVGDSLAGNDAVEQAKMFQEIMRFDGAVLTKMDTDAKGGAGLSIAYATGRPIVFAGVGQGYDDLLQFEPQWLLDQLFE